jgi:flagellar biosynthesis protein FliR
VIEVLSAWVVQNAIIFCRVGATLMVLPGFSSARVPVQVRLFLALALSLAIAPMLPPGAAPPTIAQPLAFGKAIISESVVGVVLGLQVRFVFEALHFVATLLAQSIGYAGIGGPSISDDAEQGASVVSLVTLVATTLLFATNLHIRMLIVLADSYSLLPIAEPLLPQPSLLMLVNRLGDALLLGLRLASPLVILSVLVNLCIALINKVSPAIPSFFIAQPVLLILGLLLFMIAAPTFFDEFIGSLAAWIDRI